MQQLRTVRRLIIMSLRLDDLQNGFRIYQDPELFCYGIDAVLLSHFAFMKPGDRILDMGCGNGAIPLIMRASAPEGVSFTGIEIQKKAADLARRSVKENGLENDISIIDGDIREAVSLFGAASFSMITCNPPYMTEHHGLLNPAEPKAVARHEILCTLADVTSQAEKLLVTNGRLCLIHRPFRLAEIFRSLTEHHLEPKRLRFIFPYADREPTMVLIEAVRGGRSGLRTEAPLIIYREKGICTEEINRIYGISKPENEKGDRT